MITTDHIDNYVTRNRDFLRMRHETIMQVTDAEIQAARGEDAVPPVVIECEDVLYNYYKADPEVFYSEIGFSIAEFDHLSQI